MFPYEFKPRLWPTLVTIPMVISLFLLGQWQLERLEWKLGLIEKIESRASATPTPLPIATDDLDALEYSSVRVSGIYNHSMEFTMYSIGPNGAPGYDLFTAFILDGGDSVIINRGWVPENLKQQSLRPQTLDHGEITITGLLRKPWGKLWYGPENDPAGNNWYYGDLENMANSNNLTQVFPMFLYADKLISDDKYPIAGRTEFNIVNNHLDYALTWFGLAIVLVGIYFIAHMKKKSV